MLCWIVTSAQVFIARILHDKTRSYFLFHCRQIKMCSFLHLIHFSFQPQTLLSISEKSFKNTYHAKPNESDYLKDSYISQESYLHVQ